MYDIIIIGAGPAGMTAAIYACQARKKVLLLEKEAFGGQILKADKVKNYPGYEEISGFDYSNKLYSQVKKLNPDIKFEEVISIIDNKSNKEVITTKGNYISKSIIIATGAESRKLGINNEDRLLGKGISYCATCDGAFFKDKTVAVVGGGDVALEDAIYLSRFCTKVYLIHRRDEFRGAKVLQDKVNSIDNIEII